MQLSSIHPFYFPRTELNRFHKLELKHLLKRQKSIAVCAAEYSFLESSLSSERVVEHNDDDDNNDD
uniref:Uncharacterized protein n=1 Tax=Glossina pallidipes TaxID=7398 RepID=A0A1B0ADS1_GLOPL